MEGENKSIQATGSGYLSGPDDGYFVKVDDIFEGPMDLLVHLIKKAEVDIYDIPISKITDQYLNYLEWMKMMSIDVAGDFVLMAATLTHIKSKMLLPASENDTEEEDPRLEITQPLLAYLKIKYAADALAKRDLLGESIFTRQKESPCADAAMESEQEIRIGLFDLIDAFQTLLSKASDDHKVFFSSERISVQERIVEICDLLEEKDSLAFYELFDTVPERGDIIITFLALLEMAKRSLIQIVQHVQSGIIRIFYYGR